MFVAATSGRRILTAVETGIKEALANYSDFNTSAQISYYDPYDYHSFVDAGKAIVDAKPDGVLLMPTAPQYTKVLYRCPQHM